MEGRLTHCVAAILVMELLWTVNRDTHKEVIFLEETTPLIV